MASTPSAKNDIPARQIFVAVRYRISPMTYILLHNPGCSNSRNGLSLLEDKGVKVEIRKYMNASEQLSEDELRDIAAKMGGVSPHEFSRPKNIKSEGLKEDMTDDELFAAMAANPKIIQRPIGINGDKAVLGRPNEKLLDIV
tara:strand:- start:361 stop:786 length:426 start_codon:yes stop_codon:yes gene_type:complete